MSNETDDAAAHIAFMRQLAEEGANSPFRGGSILLAAGLVFGAASLIHWAGLSGLITLEGPIFGFVWLIATVVFLTINIALILRMRRRAGVRTAADRATAAAWASVGWGIFALFASVAVFSARIADGGIAIWLAPSIIMVFYGLGWAVSAAMTRAPMMWWLAGGSFLAAPLLATLTGEDAQYLAYAGALFVLMALPGGVLMRRGGA